MPAEIHTTTDVTPRANDQSLGDRVLRILRSPRNIFGLIRQYYAEKYPDHDPEDGVTLRDLSSIPDNEDLLASGQQDKTSFHPYPNESSFRLGEWYWNHGAQKSQEDFKELLSIIGDPIFHPSHVQETKWSCINRELGLNEYDEGEWVDEDAGWTKTPITISVPFHSRTISPGARDYVMADFYHRSLASVIREKLKNQQDHALFHYEPYQLLWQPRDDRPEVRVYGELYTSPAFLEAHRNLQASPREINCDLPRVVIALMFSSDSTHLTSFGNAKLWPLYCYFGNESKYRRCKPSSHLCSHIAYFQNVSHRVILIGFTTIILLATR